MKGWVRIIISWLVCTLVLVGCASRYVRDLTPEQRALAKQMRAYKGLPPEGNYKIIKKLEGLSCQITHDDYETVISREDALEELKKAAAKEGANAVINVHCEHYPPGVAVNFCWESISCTGNAVVMKPQ